LRLSYFQIQAIKASVLNAFGENATVYLFGSRTDDDAKGGDIDLFVETQLEKKQAVLAQLQFLINVQKKIGEQKIDVVVCSPDTENKPIHEEARKTGVLL